ncbi:MAG: hypothetical protein IJU18_03155 [Oscillospiraceae bacterium]|nr:hypothetical protein [Oscillospiraceae bacterium]
MKLKPLADEDRKLFLPDALQDLPVLRVAGTEYPTPDEDCGDCFLWRVRDASQQDYENYRRAAEQLGWSLLIDHQQPLRRKYNTCAYRKDRRILQIMFDVFDSLPPTIFVTVALLPEYRYVDCGDLFDEFPELQAYPAEDCGEGNFIKTVPDADPADYEALVASACARGWEKRADNGAGLAGSVFTTLFTKNGRTLCALYTAATRRLYLTAGEGEAVSPHLKDDPARRSGFLPGAKTSLHMLEQWHFGNSFVLRLKNGHFLVSDGGHRGETPYLLDYLDSLTPPGETPVVEGWFISHAHSDHSGTLIEMGIDSRWRDRVVVDGIYFSTPSLEMTQLEPGGSGIMSLMHLVSRNLRTSAGEPTPFYRPRMGERYYFADVTVDVLHAQEILRFCDCSGDLNDTSTWLLVTVEGQTLLLGGDGDKGGIKLIMENYTPEFMTLDMMTLLHHGWNTRDEFTDFCRVKTVLFTCYRSGPPGKRAQNEYLRSKAEECLPWGDGTKVLTFPYRVGEAVCLPRQEWKYNEGETRPNMPVDPEPIN